uniref:Uncharacterized protein n=1 Tax=Fagus sylvatica TaxID=28930 RepID=A0A2N9H2D1_FAGSY
MVGENWGLKLVKPQLDNQTWFGNSSKQSGKNWDLTLSRIAIGWSDPVWKFIQTVGENWGLKLVKPQLDNQTWFGNSSKQSGKNWDLTLSRIAIGWSDPVWKFIQTMSHREVVVAEIVAGPHALDSCECMNIEGAMRASIEVVVALSAGSECTRIPYFRLSYLVVLTTCFWSLAHLVGLSNALDHFGQTTLSQSSIRLCGTIRSMVRPMDKPKVFVTRFPPIPGLISFSETFLALAIQNSLFPGFDTITDLGDSARGVHSPG